MSDDDLEFTYLGESYPLYCHTYNLTHLNERGVEIAIAHRWLWQFRPTVMHAGLEVGNVLGHYSQRLHLVFDLHEPPAWYQRNQPVRSVDILNLPAGVDRFPFPWVCSISTIEHTDDPPAAIDALKGLVEPGGKLLVTFPTGDRPELDDALGDLEAGFDSMVTIARSGEGWRQTDTIEVRPYGPWANSVVVAEWAAPL